MRLFSPSFSEGEMIPRQFTCDGNDVSPTLQWEGVPAGTKSLALVVDDPDAPGRTWVHWVLFNIPAGTTTLVEGAGAGASAGGGTSGSNSWKRAAYGGPCPPSGVHRYYFKLYALDTVLSLPKGATAAQVDASMAGHILGSAQLMGRYGR